MLILLKSMVVQLVHITTGVVSLVKEYIERQIVRCALMVIVSVITQFRLSEDTWLKRGSVDTLGNLEVN
ncbi:Uncharacterised protein [Catenibacterium mitsuokai]|nr:Uncharacterised protein [Catenibacterium mitsuokai]